MALVLEQVFHGPFYAPVYVAKGLRFFEDEGLDVAMRVAKDPSKILDSLISDDAADIVISGPARLYAETSSELSRQAVCIGQITATSFFFLVSRASGLPFRLEDLENSSLLGFPDTPTPWLCLQHLMREAGCEPDRVRRIKLSSPKAAIEAYASGEADHIELPAPYVDLLLERCGPQRITAVAPLLGRCPFSVFVASRRSIEADPESHGQFLRAIGRAQAYLREHSAGDVSEIIANQFEGISRTMMSTLVSRYRELDLWGEKPTIASEEFDHLYKVLTGRPAPDSLFSQWVATDLAALANQRR